MADQEEIDDWSHSVAWLIVGALNDAKIVSREDLERAAEIAEEEINVRLALNDYPEKPK